MSFTSSISFPSSMVTGATFAGHFASASPLLSSRRDGLTFLPHMNRRNACSDRACPCSRLMNKREKFLDRFTPTKGSFTHHAGHGVGMEGWERPWLNAGADGVFLDGEVIAFEPGLYSHALRGGIRLEHNYLITADGPIALDSFPMEI